MEEAGDDGGEEDQPIKQAVVAPRTPCTGTLASNKSGAVRDYRWVRPCAYAYGT